MYYNPVGVVALPQGKGFNKESFLQFVRDSNMKCAVVLDDLNFCASLGVPYPIYRSFTFEPQPGSSPKAAAQQAVEYIRNVPNFEKVYWHINNEPDVTLARFDMYAYMIGEISLLKLPIRCVFGNFSSGSIRCGQGGDENEWLTKAQKFLETLALHPQHFIGVHEYTSFTPWYVSEYRNISNWKSRPSKIDWSKPQWHLGRNAQGIRDACEKLHISAPRIIITEALIDRMNDLPELRLHPELNGYKTYAAHWTLQFPEFQVGELYSEFLIWAWETIYADSPVPVEGITTFCYGNTGQWQDYDVSSDPEYLKNMREYRYAPQGEPKEILPDLSNSYLAALTSLPSTYVNVREQPNALSDMKFLLYKGDQVTYYPNSISNGWAYVELNIGNHGWVSLQNGAVEFTRYEPLPEVIKPTYTKWVTVKATYDPNTGEIISISLEEQGNS